MFKWFLALLMAFSMAGTTLGLAAGTGGELGPIPVKDQVTMVNIGVEICLSCQRMTSITRELQREYKGKAAIIDVDLPKHRELSDKLELHVVPTQIFYDKNGKERFRHEGYLSKKRCIGYLNKLGVR